jgi:hypothetical protein
MYPGVKDMLAFSTRNAVTIQGLSFLLLLMSNVPGYGKILDKDKTRHDLIEIERQIGIANLNCDYKYFAAIEAPEFKFVGPDGSVTTRAQDLAGAPSCKKSSSKYEVDEASVWLDGRTAVVTGRVTIKKADPRAPVNRSRFTDVFVHRDYRWLLVAGHSSKIREPISPP